MTGADLVLALELAVIGTGLPVLLVVLLIGVMRRNPTTTGPEATADRAVACPRCGAPMQPGRTQLGRGATWSAQGDRPPRAFLNVFQTLPNTLSLAVPPALNPAWHCAPCQMLLVDHSRLVSQTLHGGRLAAIVIHGLLGIALFSLFTLAGVLLAGVLTLTPRTLLVAFAAAFALAIPVTVLICRRWRPGKG